ncbi:MAG: transposase, partial [Terriglobales bacterium]
GWNFALNRQLGDEVFHPTSLVNFRQRLNEHDQSALGFTTILQALEEAGLVSRQSRQRLDSTQMFGRVARMSRLDCVRESLRLALKELEAALRPEARPPFWLGLWERYVESQTDYRAGSETLARKLVEAGADTWQLLEWLRQPGRSDLATATQARLLARVFGEQFEIQANPTSAAAQPKIVVSPCDEPSATTAPSTGASPATEAGPSAVQATPGSALAMPSTQESAASTAAPVTPPVAQAAPVEGNSVAGPDQNGSTQAPAQLNAPVIQPKAKKELPSERVQNPHDPEATYSVKGQGENKKEHVGYKVQVAETVCEATLAPGEPTRNFLAGIVTQPAHHSDEAGASQMELEQARMGLEPPPVQYVDGAYVSAQRLAAASAQGRELIGPAAGAPDNNQGRFTTEQFQVNVEQRTAVCPAGQSSTQCSRLAEAQSSKVNYRFEWSTHCAACSLRSQCVGPTQRHRTIVVTEHHRFLQARRQEQQTPAFQQRMKHRNAIEGTQSELVRGHGLRHARYRGLVKVRLQNYFIGAACNVKRWLRREAWKLQQGLAATAAAVPAGN